MTKVVVLFLGAGKLVQLAKAFHEAAQKEGIAIELLSIEKHCKVPISLYAGVHTGPRFGDDDFPNFLIDFIKKHKVDIIIPNMDSATVTLSKMKRDLAALYVRAIVSDYGLCLTMNDKILADDWFAKHNIPKPKTDVNGQFPVLAKHRFGYGSRGLTKLNNDNDLSGFNQTNNRSDYLIQEFITAGEYTVDAYVDDKGFMIDCLCRRRLEIEAGIVSVSETEKNLKVIELTKKILEVKGWYGPITLQFFDTNEPIIIEINPRFGGGVTHALACGLDMPRWIICEFLGRRVEYQSVWSAGHFMARYRQDVYFQPGSTLPTMFSIK